MIFLNFLKYFAIIILFAPISIYAKINKTEKVIFYQNNKNLIKLDKKLNKLYKKNYNSLSQPRKKILQSSQRIWIIYRNKKCQENIKCLKTVYKKRISFFSKDKKDISQSLDSILFIGNNIMHPFCLAKTKRHKITTITKLNKCNKKFHQESIINLFSYTKSVIAYLSNKEKGSKFYFSYELVKQNKNIFTIKEYQKPGYYVFINKIILEIHNNKITAKETKEHGFSSY